MADIKISELTQAESLSTSDLLESAVPYNGGFLSRRMSLAQLSNYLENYVQHQALTTTAKTIVSAINEIVSDLVNNYYTTSQTYSKTQVDQLIAGVSGLHFEVVQQLPTTNIDMNTIYLVPKQDVGTQDIYDEYICLDDTTTPATWEKIGTTEIDLSDYVTDTELTTILNDYVTSSGLNTILANYATTSAMTTALADKVDKVSGKGLSTEDYTTVEKAKLNGLTVNDNTITIQQNGSTVDTFTLNQASNKTININAAVNNELYTEDLNDVKTVGFYCGRSGNTCTNKPSGVNQFGLYVVKLGTSNTYFKQTLIQPQTVANGGSKTYSRAIYQTTWTDWVEENYTDNKVKQTSLTYLDDNNYRILLSKSATDSEETDGVNKYGDLLYNPAENELTVTNIQVGTGKFYGIVTTELQTFQYYFRGGGVGDVVAMLEANSSSSPTNPTMLYLPLASGTLALQSQIPDELADLSDDATHRLVTDTEKSQWNSAVLTKNLSNDEDLNTLKATGFYVGASGNNCANKPSGINQFALVVIKTASSSENYCKQILIEPNPAGNTYYRTLTNYPVQNAWSNWVMNPDVSWDEYSNYGIKNLLTYPYTGSLIAGSKYTHRGVTFTDNGHGIVNVDGDNNGNGNSTCSLITDSVDGCLRLQAGTYIVTGGVSEDCFLRINRGTIGSTTRSALVNDYGEGATFTVSQSDSETYYYFPVIYVPTNKSADNVTVRPMIRHISVTNSYWKRFAKTNLDLTLEKADYRQIADVEPTDNASRAYAKNELMIWRSDLYRVTSAISLGGAISSKVTATTLSAEIKAIRDALNI